jgi:hypothetical protein
MYLETKQDLSVNYWVQNLFKDSPFVKVVDGFPSETLTIPTVAIEADDILTTDFELVTRGKLRTRRWYIYIFANSKAQRDEFGFKILNQLENTIPVYDYDLGFPPIEVPQLGCLDPEEIKMEVIRILPELTEKLYYRADVSFVSDYLLS